MDRFEEMTAFAKVIELGGISRAAERLGVAKSVVSRRLRDLEARLGVQLVKRTTRRLHLTDSGRQYYERVVRILTEVEETEQALSQENIELSGTIRLAAPQSFATTHLMPALSPFMAQHPSIRLDVDLSDRTINLMEEGIDLAIRVGRLADSTMVARRLTVVKMQICASPRYLERHGIPQAPADLEQHCALSYSNIPGHKEWQLTDNRGQLYQPVVPARLRANSGDLLLQAAINGMGIINAPDLLFEQALGAGQLTRLLEDYDAGELGMYAVYPAQRYLPQRVRVLLDSLVAWFEQHHPPQLP